MTNDDQHPTDRRSGRAGTVTLAVLCVLATVGAAFVRTPASRTVTRAEYPVPLAGPNAEFATSNACRSCHPSEYGSWHDSYHRTMTQIASPESIAAPFDRELNDGVLTCRLEQRGEEFIATVFQTHWEDRYRSAGIDPSVALFDPKL